MNKIRLALLVLVFSFTGIAHAMEGTFDRTAEVEKYIEELKSSNRSALISVSLEIADTGIGDERLAGAISERLLQDYRRLADYYKKENIEYGVFMVRALASCGVEGYAATLQQVKTGASIPKIRSAAAKELKSIMWHSGKNTIMASMRNHHDGDNPMISRLINLLLTDDVSYKLWAIRRIHQDKLYDQRVMAAIAPQVQSYVGHVGGIHSKNEDDVIAHFVKILGYSKDVQYRPLLEKVVALDHVNLGAQKHAKRALDQLQ